MKFIGKKKKKNREKKEKDFSFQSPFPKFFGLWKGKSFSFNNLFYSDPLLILICY